MDKISLAEVAHALDAMIDVQMTAQARITAHLVAAAESAGHDAGRLVATLDDVAARTVVDEFWITDEHGVVYLTNVRDADGALMPFRFDPDPAVQPQASVFHVLLSSSVDDDDAVTQEAQVREIDHGVYKYVGVSGVDRQRIVQVGNALAFEEQVSQSNAYASPVMTSVLAAFDMPEFLSDTYTSEFEEIRPIFEEILGHQMIVQATLAERFATVAREAGWSAEAISSRLRRIVRSTAIGEIHIADRGGEVLYSSLEPPPQVLPDTGGFSSGKVAPEPMVDVPTAPRASDGTMYKFVVGAAPGSPLIVQLGFPVADDSPVSPRFGGPASSRAQ